MTYEQLKSLSEDDIKKIAYEEYSYKSVGKALHATIEGYLDRADSMRKSIHDTSFADEFYLAKKIYEELIECRKEGREKGLLIS